MQNLKKHQEKKQSTLNCYFCGKMYLIGLMKNMTTMKSIEVEDGNER